jgi:hypothetical protein
MNFVVELRSLSYFWCAKGSKLLVSYGVADCYSALVTVEDFEGSLRLKPSPALKSVVSTVNNTNLTIRCVC